ncbi:hypothetical protein FRX31_027158 [Thalictrum thalictroides]|uniref:DC-UbP/UBTD2 N-terminal domain-containing protein n=1 Tax=Thalictrum thalictroides TaxID=46969 RepID=A0A7J6VGB1_THATH|nr:hypothetical protein FRX31_027158 [Thalictrum thalictroides]
MALASYTKDWWTSMNPPSETTVVQRGYMKDDSLASTSSSTWDIPKKLRKPKPWTPILPIRKDTAQSGASEILGKCTTLWWPESAGIITLNADLTTCYDKLGAKYELPCYVLSEPTEFCVES